MFTVKKLLSLALAAVVLAAVGVASPVSPVSDAQALTTVSGTTINAHTGRAMGDVNVILWRHQNGVWTNLGRKAISNSSTGRYMITGLSDRYYYAVEGRKLVGSCMSARFIYMGTAPYFLARGVSVTSNPRLSAHSMPCY